MKNIFHNNLSTLLSNIKLEIRGKTTTRISYMRTKLVGGGLGNIIVTKTKANSHVQPIDCLSQMWFGELHTYLYS